MTTCNGGVDGDSHGAENHAGTKMTDRCNRKISLFGSNERRQRRWRRRRTDGRTNEAVTTAAAAAGGSGTARARGPTENSMPRWFESVLTISQS